MKQVTFRQESIYRYILSKGSASNQEIHGHLAMTWGTVSRVTITRDIDVLLNRQLIKKIGSGRSIHYRDYQDNLLLRFFPPEMYFQRILPPKELR